MCATVLHLTMSRSESFLFVSPNIGQCTVFLYHKGMPNVVLLIKSFFLSLGKTGGKSSSTSEEARKTNSVEIRARVLAVSKELSSEEREKIASSEEKTSREFSSEEEKAKKQEKSASSEEKFSREFSSEEEKANKQEKSASSEEKFSREFSSEEEKAKPVVSSEEERQREINY